MFIPPWLTPPDPVATYQRGVQIGAQIGEAQANQRLRAQALEQEANAQAVRAAREQQEMEMTNAYRQAQLGMEASETARRVQGQMKYSALVQGGMDPMQAMMQTPEVWGSSLTGVASAMKEQERLKRLENWKPSVTKTPEGIDMAEVSPGRWQVIRPPAKALSESERVLQKLQESKGNLEYASRIFAQLPEGSDEKAKAQQDIEKAQEEFTYWDNKAKGPVTNVTATSPSGDTFSISTGSQGRIAAPGMTGNIETGLKSSGLGTVVSKKLAPIETSMEIVNWLDRHLDSSTAGPAGASKRIVGNVLGTVVPGLTPKEANEVAAKVQILREKIAREIPEGLGHQTKESRADIMAALPDAGFFSNPSNSRTKLNVIREYLMDQARNYAAEVGRKPLVSMTPTEIRKDFDDQKADIKRRRDAGLISAEQALTLARQLQAEHLNALRRFWNE